MENKEISEHFVLHLIRPASPDKKKKVKPDEKEKEKTLNQYLSWISMQQCSIFFFVKLKAVIGLIQELKFGLAFHNKSI